MSEKFVLEAVDPKTECPTSEVSFAVDDVAELRVLVEADDEDMIYDYDLTRECAAKIVGKYAIQFEASLANVRLRRWHENDDLPYRVHTNRELALMLQGLKPFALFYHGLDENLREEGFFEPYVASGKFVKREYSIVLRLQERGYPQDVPIRYVLYSLPHEEWRIDAFIALQLATDKERWSMACERLEGMLLGYENWQNDIHIENLKKSLAAKQRPTG